MAKDSEILSLISDGETQKQGFELLVRTYSEPLYYKVRHIVLYHDDANDVLQNAFIKVWNHLSSFRGQSSLATWLYRIAINEALDFIRKQKQTDACSYDELGTVANRLLADEFFDGDEAQALLQEAIATLPPVQRAVFNLRYYDEMPYAEMSKTLETSEGALKASYHLAVKKIMEYLRSRD